MKIPHSYFPYNNGGIYDTRGIPETTQDFRIYGDDIEFDVRMISKNGFKIPDCECGVEVEMKFTFTPKTPKSATITLK